MRLNSLKDLAERLRGLDNSKSNLELGFDMRLDHHDRMATTHECGSACCIAGWVKHLNHETVEMTATGAVMTIAPTSVSESEIFSLCNPRGRGWVATPQQAARAIEIVLETGKCDWEEAMK
jgi:hypothetical protein